MSVIKLLEFLLWLILTNRIIRCLFVCLTFPDNELLEVSVSVLFTSVSMKFSRMLTESNYSGIKMFIPWDISHNCFSLFLQ